MTLHDAAQLSPIDAANLLAGQAVAEAEAYLAERRDAEACAAAGHEIFLKAASQQGRQIIAPVRLLAMVMGRIGYADTDERRAKWRRVMAALVDLVRHESLVLRQAAAPEEPRHSLGETP